MNKFKDILVVVDPDVKRTPALERAIALAKASGAWLHLHVYANDPLIESTASLVSAEVMRLAKTQFMTNTRRLLKAVSATIENQGVVTSCEVIWAPNREEAILDKVLGLHPDLVVVDAPHDNAIARLLHGSTPSRLARQCPAPLMLVRADAMAMPARVAVAVDMTAPAGEHPLTAAILAEGSQLAAVAGCRLDVLHVQQPFLAVAPESVLVYEAYIELQAAQRRAFNELCEQHGIAEESRHVLNGNAAAELSMFMDANRIDVLVVGSTYRDGLDRFMLGSTAERLLNRVDCDLAIVKPAGFAADLGAHLNLEALHERQMANAA